MTAKGKTKPTGRFLAESMALLSSMRFAISLLLLLCIASVIGTVLKQNEPMVGYVNQFGAFWFVVFDKLGLYAVYSSWWFRAALGFLVLSTSLCLVRNTPKMLRDMRHWQTGVREQSLQHFPHRFAWQADAAPQWVAQQVQSGIALYGYRSKQVQKEDGILIVARKGALNRLGYLFTHAAIVIICVGGLLDSGLSITLQQWLYGKTPFFGNGLIADISEKHRLGMGTPSFRGHMMMSEGGSASTVILPWQGGVLLQDLPFSVHLSRFDIQYYPTGMPKLFASHVVVTDHEKGTRFPAVIEVNKPLFYRGFALYQSSFEDGGSILSLQGYAMKGAARTFTLNGKVGNVTRLDKDAAGYVVEWTGLRPFNVENRARAGQDMRAINSAESFHAHWLARLTRHLGSAAEKKGTQVLRNLGPGVQYSLRDENGQAREYDTYMQPVEIEGATVFLTGMRTRPDRPFRFLRIPADEHDSLDEWMRFRGALGNTLLRRQAARAYAARALPDARAQADGLRARLEVSALRALTLFAGEGKNGGYVAVAQFLEPLASAEKEKAVDIFMKMLHGSLWELWQLARQQDNLPPVMPNEQHGRFLQLAANAYSDAFFYGAPVYLQLRGFEEVKASVLQVTRSPGKNIVYFGCFLLVLGVFAMFYIRDRRLWVWIKSAAGGGSRACMAISSQRTTLDLEKECAALGAQCLDACTEGAQPESKRDGD